MSSLENNTETLGDILELANNLPDRGIVDHAELTHLDYASSGHTGFASSTDVNAKYTKPASGIPKSDLASSVQSSLGLADTALQSHQSLSAYRTSAEQDVIDATKASSSSVTAIEAKIPNQASSSNQLADKDFVNSSIATNTAYYISNNGQPFTSLEQLQAYSGTVTNNDYAFVTGVDEHGNTYYDRYKATVSGGTITWAKEYRLNNSSFTSEQWSAISSGITSVLVSSYSTHIADSTIHVTSSDKTAWNGKESSSNKVTSISSASTDTQYPSAKCVYDIVGNIESTLQAIRGV